MSIYELIGWLGAFFFILSYFLLSTDKLKANKVPYQLMNVLGAICLIVNSIALHDNPNFVINFVWMCIGLYAILMIVRKRPA